MISEQSANNKIASTPVWKFTLSQKHKKDRKHHKFWPICTINSYFISGKTLIQRHSLTRHSNWRRYFYWVFLMSCRSRFSRFCGICQKPKMPSAFFHHTWNNFDESVVCSSVRIVSMRFWHSVSKNIWILNTFVYLITGN